MLLRVSGKRQFHARFVEEVIDSYGIRYRVVRFTAE